MSTPRLSRRMSAQDAGFLYFETQNAPLQIGSVGIFEGAIDFDGLTAMVASKMHLIPRYRQRAVVPPMYAGHPAWVDDPEFAIERHVRRATLTAPGTREQLTLLSSQLFEPPLPRDRPLWDLILIDGLEDGNTAMLTRVHHCLIDGVSGVELMLVLMDLVPQPEPVPPPAEAWQPRSLPDPMESWVDAMFDQWGRAIEALGSWRENLLDPRAQFRQVTDLTRAVRRTLPSALRLPQRMPWNKPVTRSRRVAWTEFSFQEVRGIRSALGGTVNDVMLTVLSGGLGRYLRDHGEKVSGMSVRVMIPVNVRSEGEQGALGNRVSMMLPALPLDIEDPVERLKAVGEHVAGLKSDNQASAFEWFVQMAENVPPILMAAFGAGGVPGGAMNLVCTNVPGPLIPLYSVGHRMTAFYPMLPLVADLGIGVALSSYDKHLYAGVMSDPTIIEDVEKISQAMDAEFRLLRTAAGIDEADLPEIGVQRTNGASPHPVPVAAAAAESPPSVASTAT